MTNAEILDAANRIESVFHSGNASYTTMNRFAEDIFLLTTFIKNRSYIIINPEDLKELVNRHKSLIVK